MSEEQYDSATIKAFEQISTASVSDALQALGTHGYLSSQIGLVTGRKVVGPAVTVREIPTTESLPPTHALEAIDAASEGDVIVIDVGAEHDVAVWGGLMTAGAVANGLGGVILDAGVRDVEEITRDFDGFTVFARSTSPATTLGRFKTISSGEPVVVGGVTINPGDLVVADRDGVVAVPRDLVAQTLAGAQEIEDRERAQTRLILESGSLATGLAKYNRI